MRTCHARAIPEDAFFQGMRVILAVEQRHTRGLAAHITVLGGNPILFSLLFGLKSRLLSTNFLFSQDPPTMNGHA